MAKRLLDRQTSLVEYMTSGAAIFGDKRGLSLPQALQGIDCGLLYVEAHFSYAKRMEKITAVLPKTFELMGSGQAQIAREFVESCPPVTISRLENARQFHAFLSVHRTREVPSPPYICDVAACELACAEADVNVEDRDLPVEKDERGAARRGIRRCPAVVLLRCAYDIRPIFEAGPGQAVPAKRETRLVVALPPGADKAQVFEVSPAVFDLLAALDDWTDPRALDTAPELAKLIADLTEHGLVEARQ
jgi:hypothetical protein